MIKVSVLYPYSGGEPFDMEYYLEKHMPMVRQKLADSCKGMAVDGGVAGGVPDAPPTYTVMGHLLFDSPETFQAAFAEHAKAIMEDIPNYTSIHPIIQVSEVKMQE